MVQGQSHKKIIENQQSINISLKEMKFDGREMTCVCIEITRVSTEIDQEPAAMTKNLTEMKSDGAEMIRVGIEMSCVSTEIDFVGPEMIRVSAEIDFVCEEMTAESPNWLKCFWRRCSPRKCLN